METRDEDLMRDVQAGGREAFEALVRRYRAALLRLAASKLSDQVAAEDVVQETFLAVFAARHSYRPEFPFRTWLWTIALNLCKRHGRRSMKSAVPGEPSRIESWGAKSARQSTSLEAILKAERDAQLRQALDELPEAQADALRLRFFGDLKFEEIAAAMECSLNGAKRRVKMGLKKLAALLPALTDREP
jgi:RNA polymerase sigma-70 factor (ECF subfamily)